MTLLIYYLGAFFLGAVPNAYLAGRLLGGVDIRSHGSGNVGATNVARVLGKGPGYAVFALDFLKGVVPVLLFTRFFPEAAPQDLLRFSAGLAAVLGHVFTPFLAFKGGKGVATGAGAVCAGFPMLFAISTISWLLIFAWTRVVSISSLAAVAVLAVTSFATGQTLPVSGVFLACFLFVVWSHRSNLKRLLSGKEHVFHKSNK